MYAMMKIVMMLLIHLNDSLHVSACMEDDCDDLDSRNDLDADGDDVDDNGHISKDHLKEGLQVQVSGAVHSPLMQPREHQGAQICRVMTSKY